MEMDIVRFVREKTVVSDKNEIHPPKPNFELNLYLCSYGLSIGKTNKSSNQDRQKKHVNSLQ